VTAPTVKLLEYAETAATGVGDAAIEIVPEYAP
jgi:hypothetical protein